MPRVPRPLVPNAGKEELRPVLAERKPSRHDAAGTRHRHSSLGRRRQCGDAALRMFVMPRSMPVTNFGGLGIPHRAITNSRLPSAPARTIGAILSGKMRGSGGKLPVVSRSRVTSPGDEGTLHADKGITFVNRKS